MENKKKVLFVVPALSNGGAERVVARVSSELANHNYDVHILSFYKVDKEYEVNKNVKLHNLSNGTFEDYQKICTLKRLKLIRKKVKEINPDVILPFLEYLFIYVIISLWFSKYRKNTYYLLRNNPKYQSKKVSILTSILTNFSRKIIVQNQGQKNYFSKRKQKKIFIVPNPVDKVYLDYQKQFKDKPQTIVSIGRLEKQKNYELALNSFAKICKDYPELRYVIYGKGSLLDSLNEQCKKLKIEDKVEFKGFSSNFKEIYDNGDIYLMSSIYEGMPNALAEAISIGLPVISTNCEYGPKDLILDSKIGILVRENSEEELIDAIKNVVEKYQYYSSLSEYRKNIMKENYSFDKIINLWINVL